MGSNISTSSVISVPSAIQKENQQLQIFVYYQNQLFKLDMIYQFLLIRHDIIILCHTILTGPILYFRLLLPEYI